MGQTRKVLLHGAHTLVWDTVNRLTSDSDTKKRWSGFFLDRVSGDEWHFIPDGKYEGSRHAEVWGLEKYKEPDTGKNLTSSRGGRKDAWLKVGKTSLGDKYRFYSCSGHQWRETNISLGPEPSSVLPWARNFFFRGTSSRVITWFAQLPFLSLITPGMRLEGCQEPAVVLICIQDIPVSSPDFSLIILLNGSLNSTAYTPGLRLFLYFREAPVIC